MRKKLIKITANEIVMYDNYDKQHYKWAWFPNYEGDEELYFRNEKDMIESFIQYMFEKDPDRWFGHYADLHKLIERCGVSGINPMLIELLENWCLEEE